MAVVYYKIGRALIKQNKYIKSVCSNPVRRSAPSSFFNIGRFIRNRKTFFVCLSTVLCYGVGDIPFTVYLIWEIAEEYGLRMKYNWILHLASVLRIAGSHSVQKNCSNFGNFAARERSGDHRKIKQLLYLKLKNCRLMHSYMDGCHPPSLY